MQNSIFSWIRKQQFKLQIFVAVMVNLMAFSQPISYTLNGNGNAPFVTKGNYYKLLQPVNFNQQNISDVLTNNLEPSSNRAIKTKQSVREANFIKSTATTIVNFVDKDIIDATEKQGIIGKSENLPIDELTDNIFSFTLKAEVKKDKDVYLEYELFGLADGSQAIKSFNDQMATGGSIIKTTKEWTKVREKVNPKDIHKGNNNIKFTTWENSNFQYMVRNLKLVYDPKPKVELAKQNKTIEMPIEFHQSVAKSYLSSIAISGFITDPTIQKVNILGNDYPVINGVFEALVEEKEPKSNLFVSYIDAKGYKIENNIKVEQLLVKPTELHKETKSLTSISKIFIKSQRNNLTFGGAKLQVDTLSLDENQKISITGLRYVDVPTLSPEMVNVTADYYGCRMLPNGDLFSKKPAKIFLKYDQTKLPTGYTAKDIKTFYFDNDQKRWMALEKDTILDSTSEIVSKTNHFTDFINGIIKVPESPETGSFTPTSIKDIKAAEPTAGVVSIAPPSPNNMGTVNTSFPIKLPAGRSGMQPSLSVNYSSESGNGWMGLGWDLSIPGVSLDTRWGAPRYDTAKETEIYSLGGGMLTLKDGSEYTNPHRKDNLVRTSERQFYPRIEGSYARIIRHGSNPTNYWWEVIDKMGNKSFYGGYGNAVVNNAVVKTAGGVQNIAYWGLYKTEDTNGNYVEYIYHNQNADMGGAHGQDGNEFYIKEIKYTMHTVTQSNYYKVDFVRTVGRTDVQVNGRNGVLQVTKDLLKEIKIGLQQGSDLKPIRSYQFRYDVHTFYKNQLTKISEFDANGDLFYSNTMEYEDKGDDGSVISNNNILYNQGENIREEAWNGNSDNVIGDLTLSGLASAISGEFSNKGSLLGTSKGSGLNGELYIGFGASCTFTNKLTAGINFGYSNSTSKGLIAFTDINGDGLPDKVFKDGESLKFRSNLGILGTSVGFGMPQNITGINDISKTSSNTFSVGAQVSFGAFVGYTYNTSKSTTKTYFSNVNGDGLVDLVDGGSVKFNQTLTSSYLNSANFNSNNSQTSNPVGSGVISTDITNNITLETKDQLRDENPQNDIVKVWIAPKSGTVTISGTAVLSPLAPTASEPYPNSTDEYFNDYDGVRLSIQKNTSTFPSGSGTVILDNTINPTFNSSATVNVAFQNMSVTSLSVSKGDRLYFRVHSKEEGTYDRVESNYYIFGYK